MLYFRADGNSFIGSGHVMRCLSIADEAKRQGEETVVLCADESFEDEIRRRGHMFINLQGDYQNLEAELPKVLKLPREDRPSAFFLDSYYVTAHYMAAVKEACEAQNCRLVYLDDILSFAYPCHVLLNYNIYGPDREARYRKMYSEEARTLPEFLLGTDYAPLRAEFSGLSEREVRKDAKEILISTGGADAEHMGLAFVQELLSDEKYRQYRFHLLIGSRNEDRNEIEALVGSQNLGQNGSDSTGHIVIHPQVTKMAEFMQSVDLAISAAGSTLYELCATQTPTVTYVLADNQLPGAQGFVKHGIMKCTGDVQELGTKKLAHRAIAEAIRLAGDHEERCRIAARQREIVDGRGAGRIVCAVRQLR